MNIRIEKINKYLRYWQIFLNLQAWKLNIKFKLFDRTDYPQSGDIAVDNKNKKATIYLSKQETGKDNSIILHELLHLILWKYDHFAEKFIDNKNKDEYFIILEKTIADLELIIYKKDK